MLKRSGLAFLLVLACALGAGAGPLLADDAPPPGTTTTAPPPPTTSTVPTSTTPTVTTPTATTPTVTTPTVTTPTVTKPRVTTRPVKTPKVARPRKKAPRPAPRPRTVPRGVLLGPVRVGGMTVREAVAAVNAAFSRPLKLRVAGHRETVSPVRFHTRVPAKKVVRAALRAQPATRFRLRATVSRTLVRRYVATLARRYDRLPVAGSLVLLESKPVLTPTRAGLAVRQMRAAGLIRQAVVDGTRGLLDLPVRATQPKQTAASTSPVIVIRRGSNRLNLYRGATLVRTFPVATGQPAYPTPLGAFHIVVMWKNPTWYPPTQDDWAKGLQPVPPGPDNPLGTRWMGISSPGVGIHGTDDPASIGYSVSHGCIRMQVPEAEWLFDHVEVGTPVYIVPS